LLIQKDIGELSNMAYNPGLPIGAITLFGGIKETVPPGWLYCDGSEYLVGNYFDLFKVINHYYGDKNLIDLSTPLAIQNAKSNPAVMTSNFKVPDFRGRAAVGYGRGKQYPDTTNNENNLDELSYTLDIGYYQGTDGFITETGIYSGPRLIPTITVSFIIKAL